MTGAIVTGSGDPHGLGRLERFYAFDVAPVVVRNTFAAGYVLSLERPAYYFTASTISANRLLELAIERQVNDVRFEGPNNEDAEQYPELISCQWWGSAADPAQLDSGAEIGLEFFSYEQNPPFAAPSSTGCVQLVQKLNNKHNWALRSNKGDGVTATTEVAFTAPAVPPGEGHRVALVMDPFSLKVSAIVDGVMRAEIASVYPNTSEDLALNRSTIRVGAFLKMGASVGTGTSVFASWTAFKVANYGTGGAGAGLP